MSPIPSLKYCLESGSRLNWTATQEKTISRDYPFVNLNDETAEQYVIRTYLQYLWLPESIMPLNTFVPSFLRVNLQLSDIIPHPFHTHLDAPLLTSRASANKYHVELPQILSDGGGAGEIEETMMWFAMTYEKTDQDHDKMCLGRTGSEGLWLDETWRKQWLDRLERREVQIQILLHFLKLSLQGPAPPIHVSQTAESPPKKRKRSARKPLNVEDLSNQDRLESFMDKLSMWQLMSGLQPGQDDSKPDQRDWMQVFCEDVVELQFNQKLPDLCALLRSKVFPNSPFAEDSSPGFPPSHSPTVDEADEGQQLSHKRRPDIQHQSSVALISTSARNRSASISRDNRNRDTDPTHSQSHTLSITLAQDSDARRTGSIGAVGTKKRIFNKEVSMSRVFKSKAKEREKDEVENGKKKAMPHKQANANARQGTKSDTNPDIGVTLVAATPVKPKLKSRILQTACPLRSGAIHGSCDQDLDEENWGLPGSPDVLLFTVARTTREPPSDGIGGRVGEVTTAKKRCK